MSFYVYEIKYIKEGASYWFVASCAEAAIELARGWRVWGAGARKPLYQVTEHQRLSAVESK